MAAKIENLDPQSVVQEHNGAVFVARKVHDVPLFKIAALIKVGSWQDTISGIAHFFEHLPFNNTRNYKDNQIFSLFEKNGGFINAFTDYDRTVFHGEVLKENFRTGIEGIAELVCHPIFEGQRVIDEAATIMTEWARAAMTQGRQRSKNTLQASFGEHAARNLLGNPEHIKSIKAEDAAAFYARYYTMDNLIVYMQGDCDQEQLLDEAIKQFSLPRGPENPLEQYRPFIPSTLSIPLPTPDAAHVRILYPALSSGDDLEKWAAANLFGKMLFSMEGSLLREARLEKRLVYGIEPVGLTYVNCGAHGLMFDAFSDKVPEICEIIIKHIDLMATNPDRSLFESIRKNECIGLAAFLKKDDENDTAKSASDLWSTGQLKARDAYLNVLKNTTLDDVTAYAQTYIAKAPLSLVYEGTIANDFPDHTALMAMRHAVRTAATSQRLTGAPARGGLRPEGAS